MMLNIAELSVVRIVVGQTKEETIKNLKLLCEAVQDEETQESKIGMSYVDGHYVILSVKKHCPQIFK